VASGGDNKESIDQIVRNVKNDITPKRGGGEGESFIPKMFHRLFTYSVSVLFSFRLDIAFLRIS